MATTDAAPFLPEVGENRFPGWFSDRVRHWRRIRGLSQEALGLAAEISTRHLSFLESGRAKPSEEMIFRLFSVLDVPLGERNRILVAEGREPRYPDEEVPTPAEDALRLLMEAHDPFPLVVLSSSSTVLRANRGASNLFREFSRCPRRLGDPFDMVELVLDPSLCREFILDWEALALRVLQRLHRSCLEKPRDASRRNLLERALAYEGVSVLWEQRTESVHPDPIVRLRLSRGDLALEFRTVVTTLAEPLEPALREIYVETYFPRDEATRAACRGWADAGI